MTTVTSSHDHLMPVLPGYTVVEQLYLGSRAAVYRAVQDDNRRSVVVKVLLSDYPTFGELVQFRNQYAIAKNLNLPGVIRSLSLQTVGNGYALVMEDWGGSSLSQYLQEQSLDLAETLEIALQLAEVLHGLHQQRVIHKDIKPANILIRPESKEVKLIDFSIASLLPKETQEIQNPNILEGTLAYLAPEQTGRMNRGIDYRADFYALGVTLYQLLTGQLPFESHDPMELLHCHIAKTAQLVNQVNPAIPGIVGAIVAKLMAKNAEDRYQSGLGLQHDLQECLTQWQATGAIADFELGQRDLSDRFLIPEKLYGREADIEALLAAFGRVSHGASELMLVAGFSGIGKTAVINEVHKPIVKQHGYFIKGKFDQFNRNIPFSAFVHAFRDLIIQLLGESDAQLAVWKSKILKALGDNAQVIIEVIPELERLLGQQPSVPELSGAAAQNRFNLLFQKFISVFTIKDHPLVIFLDDLQWADSASLNLLKLLMSESLTGYLFILGAYRDNEVFPAHPLMLMLGEIQKGQSVVHTITLTPLSKSTINQLVADSLSCDAQVTQPLTELVYQKTQGNPFFTTQFLKALYEDGWIQFQFELGYWQCDMTAVRQLALTDDVVEFMALQLQKLPVATQQVLKLAACIGNQFDLSTLAIVAEQSAVHTATDLWKALQEGLIIPIDESYKFFQASDSIKGDRASEVTVSYKFLHDRVQQAAYSLIPEAERATVHYQIGQLLQQQLSPTEQAERIFELVNYLNYGIEQLRDWAERNRLAQLNLNASLKARAAIAYQAAHDYAQNGIDLLGEEGWGNQPETALMLHELAAEAACLCGDFEQMEQWIHTILTNTTMPRAQAKAYQIRIQAFVAQNNFQAAISTGVLALKQFDIHLSAQQTHDPAQQEFQSVLIHPTFDYIQQEIQSVLTLIGDRPIESLLDLPKMRDADQIAILGIATSLIPVCYNSHSPLFPLVIVLSIKRSLEFGNAPGSCFSYLCYGVLLIMMFKEIDLATQLGRLGYRLAQEPDARKFLSVCLVTISLFIHHRQSHLQETLPMFQTGYQVGIDIGAIEDAGYNAHNFCWGAWWCGRSLPELAIQIRTYQQQLLNLNQLSTAGYCAVYLETVLCLLGQPDAQTLVEEHHQIYEHKKAQNDLLWVYKYHLHYCLTHFLLGDVTRAAQAALQVRTYLGVGIAAFGEVHFYFYDSLICLSALSTDFDQRNLQLQQVRDNQAQLQHWAHHAPMNYLHKWQLVEAKYLWATGNRVAAIDLYDRAISGARENGYIQDEAIANELAAKFYLDWGKEKVAAGYMQEAYYCYARWGATAKVADLEQRYAQLLQPILQVTNQPLTILETLATISDPVYAIHSISDKGSSNSINHNLDFAALLQTSQVFASTIALDELLRVLTQTMMKNSGADRCALMLCEDEQWQVRVMANLEGVVLQSAPLDDHLSVPSNLIQYVKNTVTTVVVDDLKTDLPVIGDYLLHHQPKSVLCLPILNQGNLCAILYLENHSTSGIFTSDRIVVLNFLCTQAAISLENARLYQRSQEYSQQLERSLHELNATQSRFHNLVDNVPGVVYQFLMATDGSVSMPYISNACYNLYEVTAEQAIADVRILMDMVHPEDVESHDQSIANSVKNLTPWQWEGRIITPSGQVKWIHGEARIKQLADGALLWDGLLLDISHRKEVEAALIESETYHRTLFDQASIGLALCRMSGQLLYCNPAYASILGRTTDELPALSYLEITPESYVEQEQLQLQSLQTTGRYGPYEKEYIHKDGYLVPVRLSGIIVERNGEQFIWSSVEDISDRKAAEATIQQKSQDLENTLQELQNAQLQMVQNEKMASLGNLVAGVAHEINNPIGFLNGSINNGKDHMQDLLKHLELYRQHYPNPAAPIQDHAGNIDLDYICEDFPQLLNSMQGATDRIKSISTSLRTFSRADTEYKVSANLHEGIDSTLLILKYRLKANEQRPAIEVVTNYGDIPMIDCFPGQLNQVFMNILANAIDMFDEMAQGRSFKELEAHPQRITISTALVNHQVQISIRDNGKGIDAEVQSRIFDHLFTTKSVGKGTGLGLAIAQQIVVDKHGGSLTVESELGQGAEFWIELPIKS